MKVTEKKAKKNKIINPVNFHTDRSSVRFYTSENYSIFNGKNVDKNKLQLLKNKNSDIQETSFIKELKKIKSRRPSITQQDNRSLDKIDSPQIVANNRIGGNKSIAHMLKNFTSQIISEDRSNARLTKEKKHVSGQKME